MVSGLRRRAFGRLAGVGVAAAMLLAGCGGRAPSNPTPTTVQTPSATTSSSSGTASSTAALRPSRWVVRPDGPFPLGGLTIAASPLVIAQQGTCCDDPPSAKFAAYDSARHTWRLLPDHPGGGPGSPVAVWTGSQVVVFGEAVCPTCTASEAAPTRTVYSFNPATWPGGASPRLRRRCASSTRSGPGERYSPSASHSRVSTRTATRPCCGTPLDELVAHLRCPARAEPPRERRRLGRWPVARVGRHDPAPAGAR